MNNAKKRLSIIVFSILWVAATSMAAQAETQKGEERMTISSGKTVSIEYTLTLENKWSDLLNTIKLRYSRQLPWIRGSCIWF